MKKVLKIILVIILIVWVASEIFNYVDYREAISVEKKGAFKRTHKYQLVIVNLFYDVFPFLDESPELCKAINYETGDCFVR
jgi:hypothetical protein